MIKIICKTGDSYLDEMARQRRDGSLKPTLKGMRCKACKRDTFIHYKKDPNPLIRLSYTIDYCCKDFKLLIEQKIQNQSI